MTAVKTPRLIYRMFARENCRQPITTKVTESRRSKFGAIIRRINIFAQFCRANTMERVENFFMFYVHTETSH